MRATNRDRSPAAEPLPLTGCSKVELRRLADRLHGDDSDAVEQCVAFLEAESWGLWHGRARAMIARRLKHRPLAAEQRERVLRAILQRLVSGRFAEQFKDQLRLARYLDAARVDAVARSCEQSPVAHVRRYADWLLRPRPPR